MSEATRDCIHGHLARTCDICAAWNDHATACEQNEKLRALLGDMVALAEFWIGREYVNDKSESEYRIWLALGYHSSALRNAKAALKAEGVR